jgi:FtsP/CotA-like multicopper oxidase with cupredoxin domain
MHMYLFLVVWSSLTTVAVSVVVGNTVHYDLVFDRRVVRPDGVARAAVTVNGQLPGPPLVAFVGDTVVVNVTNMGE